MRARVWTVTTVVVVWGVLVAGCGATSSPPAGAPADLESQQTTNTVGAEISALEQEHDARVGLGLHDLGSGQIISHRAGERFGFASTLKAFAAAEMLRQVPAEERDQPVTWSQADVDAAGYSPVTEQHVDDGLTIAQLAEATVRESDNLALNLVLRSVGGPDGLRAGLEDLGDTITRVVDEEPDLNTIEPGNADNTTTATAFLGAMTDLLRGDHLTDPDRSLLLEWMSGNATGDTLVRAGAPAGWEVADKSGGAGAIRNDVAVVTPPGRAPIVVVVLTEKLDPGATYDDQLVADVARAALRAVR